MSMVPQVVKPIVKHIFPGIFKDRYPINLKEVFLGGKKGLLFHFWDKATLLQDPKTYVAASSDPISMVLDQSHGEVREAELVDTANTASAWTIYGTNTVVQDVDGSVKITYVDNINGAYIFLRETQGLSADLDPDSFYELTLSAKSQNGVATFRIGDAPIIENGVISASIQQGSYAQIKIIFKTTGDASAPYIRPNGMTAGEIVWFKDISVKKITGSHGIQTLAASRPLYTEGGGYIYAAFDGTDDEIVVTPSVGFTGTVFTCTRWGTWVGKVNITSTFTLRKWNPLGMVAVLIVEGDVSTAKKQQIVAELNRLTGVTQRFNEVGALGYGSSLRENTELTEIDVTDWFNSSHTTLFALAHQTSNLSVVTGLSTWDTQNCTSIQSMFNTCQIADLSGISGWDVSKVVSIFQAFGGNDAVTSLDISSWNLPVMTAATNFCNSCHNLVSVNVGNAFNNSPCISYNGAFGGCALNQASVDAVLVSINAAGTSGGILHINGGTSATPSAIGQAATDSMRGRSWLVYLNGY